MNRAGCMLIFLFVNSCCHLPPTKQINWADYPQEQTIKDAFLTWNQYFREKVAPNIARTRQEFDLLLAECSEVVLREIDEIEPDMENARFQNYRGIKTAEEAYPPHDRPRGNKDVASVKYHAETQELVSPIIVIEAKDVAGKSRIIKLDGVHRIMAAIIRNSKVKIFYIKSSECRR